MMALFTPQQQWDTYRKLPEQDMYDYSPFLRACARGNVLEIGVCQGVSTAAILLGLEQKHDGHLWSIDIDSNCGELYEHPRWTFIAGDSQEVTTVDLPPLDMLFVDGDHGYKAAISDLHRFSLLVVANGIIMMHDVKPSAEWLPRIKAEAWYPVEECQQAWQKFCEEHPDWWSFIVPGQTGLGVMVKREAQA